LALALAHINALEMITGWMETPSQKPERTADA
jgi:hypothetical protein